MGWFGFVYWALTPQQQPGSSRGGAGGDHDQEIMSVSLVEDSNCYTANNCHWLIVSSVRISKPETTIENIWHASSATAIKRQITEILYDGV